MRAERPLLTLAVPTCNRSKYLAQLLFGLCEQLVAHPEIELLISDNASSDATRSLVSEFENRLPNLRYLRNEINLGPDANFLQCLQEAKGKYVWLLGDDDIIVPGSLDKIARLLDHSDYSLVYVRPYPFRDEAKMGRENDRFGRFAQKIPNGAPFIRIVGPMITFISSLIVNKARYEQSQWWSKLESLIGTNLIQLGWSLPILASGGESLIIWDKILAARVGNSGGYGICRVFGKNLNELLATTVSHDDKIRRILINSTLRDWFPTTIIQIRYSIAGFHEEEDFHTLLEGLYRSNWRYWVYVSPVIGLPRLAARAWWAGMDAINRGVRLLELILNLLRWRGCFIRSQRYLDQ